MSHTTFFTAPKYNHIGREKLWIDACFLAHDSWCGCDHPVAHFISSVLPIGHKDRDLTVEEILSRDLKAKCHSGGAEETNGGPQQDLEGEEGPTREELEKLFSDDAIEELIDAARKDEEPR